MENDNKENLESSCEQRSKKFAAEVAKITGIDQELLERAYMKSCGKWKAGYIKGVKSWAEREGKLQETPVETSIENPVVEEPAPEAPLKESDLEKPTNVPTEEPAATSEQD